MPVWQESLRAQDEDLRDQSNCEHGRIKVEMYPVITRLKEWTVRTRTKITRDKGARREKRLSTSSTGGSCQGAPDVPRSPLLSSQAAGIRPPQQDGNFSTSSTSTALSREISRITTCDSCWVVLSDCPEGHQATSVCRSSARGGTENEGDVSQGHIREVPTNFEEGAPAQTQSASKTEKSPPEISRSSDSIRVADPDLQNMRDRSLEELHEVHQSNCSSISSRTPRHEILPSGMDEERPKKSRLDSLTLGEDREALCTLLKELISKKNDWDRLRRHRKNELKLRSLLQDQRNLVKEIETEKQDADNVFMKQTRKDPPLYLDPYSEEQQRALQQSYAKLQRSRNEYGPALEECMQREEALDDEEWEMGRIEDQLYSTLFGEISNDSNLPSHYSYTEAAVVSASTPSPWLGLVAGIQERYEPLQTAYLSRLGDMDLAKERLANLQREEGDLLGSQEHFLELGLSSIEEGDTSKGVSSRQAEIRKELNDIRSEMSDIESDIERLRRECLEAGINPDDLDVDADGRNDHGSGYSLSLYEGDVQEHID